MGRTLVRFQIVLLLISAAYAPTDASAQPAAVSRYTLNGKSIEPSFVSLNGTPERPVPGDLMWLDGMFLVYNGETVGDFRSTPPEDGRLLVRTSDGTEQAVGAKIGWTYKDDTKVVYNPLARLSDSEIRRLRGILIDEWNGQIADRLRHLDPHAACVTITGYTGQEPAGSLPPLPAGLQYLNIDAISGNKIEDFSRLRDQTALRFLTVRATGGVVDARDVVSARNLRFLDLGGNELRNVSELRNLAELRTLDLAYVDGVDNLAFATPMKRLTYLDIRNTQVRDLTPLDGLDALKSVFASRAPVATLPRGALPELRQLDVMSTALDDRTVARFAAAHSSCHVQFHWMAALRDVLPGVTRARVRTGGTCHRDPRQERTLFETQDIAQINELLGRITIDESHEQFECMCCGEPSFEFYRGEKLIASLGFHHGHSIRWPGVWPGDGALTEESALAVCQWLAKHGAPDSLKQFEAQKRARQAAQRRTNEYSRLLPKELETRLRKAESPDDAVAALQSGLDDKIERAKLLLRLYGCDQGSWNLYFGWWNGESRARRRCVGRVGPSHRRAPASEIARPGKPRGDSPSRPSRYGGRQGDCCQGDQTARGPLRR